MKRDLNLTDVLYHRGYTKDSLGTFLKEFHKDSPNEKNVFMVDYALDRTYRYTVGELRTALHDMYDREATPQLVNEITYENLYTDFRYNLKISGSETYNTIDPNKMPTLEKLIESGIIIAMTPCFSYFNDYSGVITYHENKAMPFDKIEDVDWNEWAVLYKIRDDGDGIVIRGIPKNFFVV